MVTGVVNAKREAIVEIVLAGPGGRRTLPAAVDTGFDGALVVPGELVAQLRLRRRFSLPVVLGEGSEALVDVYRGEVDWFGSTQPVEVLESGGQDVLLGTTLLDGHRLLIDYAADEVTIQ